MDSGLGQNEPGQSGRGRGVFSALAAGCFWGSVGVFVRVLTGFGYSPMTIMFVRVSIGFAILFVMLIATGRKSLLHIRLKDLWCFIGTGVSSAVLLNLFFSLSTLMNSLSLAAILLSTAPIFVVMLSVPIFGERITSVKVQALVICFAGCVLTSGIVDNGAVFSARGVIIGLIAGIGYAMYSIMTRFALNHGYNSLTVNVYSFGIGALVSIPFTNFALVAATVSAEPGKMAAFLVLHTLCTSLFPYMLFTYSMKFMDTGRAAILVSIEPVAATVFGIVFYGEVPSAVCVIGIILVLFALVLLNVPGGLSAIPSAARSLRRR